MGQTTAKKTLSLKSLTKSSVWDIQENDVFRMIDSAEKDTEAKENIYRYIDIIRSAFTIEELRDDTAATKKKYEKLGYKVGQVKIEEGVKVNWAIKKRPILRVSDLTYENIRHISAAKLMEVLDRNFGGGWDSLSQSIQDIIESGFDISTTTLPKERLHKKGGMYEKKVADGYEVLEVEKGLWVEAIFAKTKPEAEKPRMKFDLHDSDSLPDDDDFEKSDDMEEPDEFNEDEITEDNYRTTFEIEENPDEEAENISEYGDEE